MTWTTAELVVEALGPTAGLEVDDPWLVSCTAAANVAAPRKRREAGYTDDPDVSPGADVTLGTTMWAVALVRERAAVDGYPSFEEMSSYVPTGGSWGQIRRLLGVGRAGIDQPPAGLVTARRQARARHRLLGWPR